MTNDNNATTPTVKFGELPPADGKRPRKFEPVADALRENPGRWALITTCDNREKARQFVYNARIGSPAAFRPVGHFEFEYRGLDVWARYTLLGVSR